MSAPDPRCQRALDAMLAGGASLVSPRSVLRARDVLELSGEAIRNRLCLFPDNDGDELAMRPDMTTPIAMMLVDGEIGAGRHAYRGDVYRLPLPGHEDATEFEQVGFEWFGEVGVEADAAAFHEAAGMAVSAGVEGAIVRVGDVALFRAVVGALDLAPNWADRLCRAFARVRGPEHVLDAAEGSRGKAEGSLRLGDALSKLDADAACEALDEVLQSGAAAPVMAGRSVEEIAERLVARSQMAPLNPESADFLRAYLRLRAPIGSAVDVISKWAAGVGLEIDEAVQSFAERVALIGAQDGASAGEAEFVAGLGRRFEYYDGFVFEFLLDAESTGPFLAGGRYDGIIARMDEEKGTPAIGAALRADRLPLQGGG